MYDYRPPRDSDTGSASSLLKTGNQTPVNVHNNSAHVEEEKHYTHQNVKKATFPNQIVPQAPTSVEEDSEDFQAPESKHSPVRVPATLEEKAQFARNQRRMERAKRREALMEGPKDHSATQNTKSTAQEPTTAPTKPVQSTYSEGDIQGQVLDEDKQTLAIVWTNEQPKSYWQLVKKISLLPGDKFEAQMFGTRSKAKMIENRGMGLQWVDPEEENLSDFINDLGKVKKRYLPAIYVWKNEDIIVENFSLEKKKKNGKTRAMLFIPKLIANQIRSDARVISESKKSASDQR